MQYDFRCIFIQYSNSSLRAEGFQSMVFFEIHNSSMN